MVNIYIKALIFMGVALFMLEAVSQLSNTEYSYPQNLCIHIYIFLFKGFLMLHWRQREIMTVKSSAYVN